MAMRLEGRVAIVTGAGRAYGIGEAIALRLAEEGAHVAVVDLCRQREHLPREQFGQWDELQAVAEKILQHGVRAIPVKADVTNEDEVAAMVALVAAKFGRIDILCNNAGGGTGAGPVDRTDVVDLPRAAWDYTFDASLTSTFLCSKHAARTMIAESRGGSIVNTVSVSAHGGMPGGSAYAAAKFALLNFTQTLALELAPHRIRVNAFSPGITMTQYVQQRLEAVAQAQGGKTASQVQAEWVRGVPLGRAATPGEMASVAAFLASEDSSYMTGQTLIVDGGLTAR
jgi:NAD(P)-dependent dehydrogenase (short-subunit alcohol dehydrogenase family)